MENDAFDLHLQEFNQLDPEERMWLGGVYMLDGEPYEFSMIDDEGLYHFYSFTFPQKTIILNKIPDKDFSIELTKKLYLQDDEPFEEIGENLDD